MSRARSWFFLVGVASSIACAPSGDLVQRAAERALRDLGPPASELDREGALCIDVAGLGGDDAATEAASRLPKMQSAAAMSAAACRDAGWEPADLYSTFPAVGGRLSPMWLFVHTLYDGGRCVVLSIHVDNGARHSDRRTLTAVRDASGTWREVSGQSVDHFHWGPQREEKLRAICRAAIENVASERR